MKEYMITIWANGHRWSEVVGTTNIKGLAKLYKDQYNRVQITDLNRGAFR